MPSLYQIRVVCGIGGVSRPQLALALDAAIMELMSSRTVPLDIVVEIVTPENVAFRYRVSGPFRRLAAYAIDMVIRATAWGVASMAAMIAFTSIGLPGFGLAAGLVFWFVMAWLYGGLFEALWNGQTPGKRMMNLRVLTAEGLPIDGWQALLRNVLRAADMQPFYLYLVGLISATMNSRFQRLGDLAAGTMVVVEEPRWFQGVIHIAEPEAIRLAGEIPAGFQAGRTMARALAAYVQRRQRIPLLRRVEIARHLAEPLRQRFNLPAEINLDLLVCALYHRTFITDRPDEQQVAEPGSPFGEPPANPFATASDGAPAPS